MSTPWWREPTRGQWMAFSAAWLGWVLDAFDFTIYLLVLPRIAAEFGVSLTATASSITLTLLLRLAGGFAAGAVADRWGRKLPLMISMVWFAVCDGAIAFAPSFTWVLILRTLFGFGMGAEWTSGTTLAMESWPARSRGIASGVLQGSWAIGYLLASIATAYVVPAYGWRGLFVLAAIPALLVLPIRFLVPESRPAGTATASPPVPVTAFLRPEHLPRLIWGSMAMLCGLAFYYGMTALYPTLLTKELGVDTVLMARHVQLFNVGMLAGSVVCGIVAARRGPILAVIVPATIMILLMPIYVGLSPVNTLIGAVLGGVFGAGIAGVTPLLLTSLFPAELRARGVGLCYHLGAFGAAFVPPLITVLRERAGLPLAWALLLVSSAGLAAMVVVLLVRPRNLFSEVRS